MPEDGVVPVGLVVADPGEGNVGQKIFLGTEIAAHAEGEGVLVVGVVHAEEVDADAQVAVFGRGECVPIRAARAFNTGVGLDVVPREVLAAAADIVARLLAAP